MDTMTNLIQLINNGNYDESENICKKLNFKNLENDLIKYAYDSCNFSLYSFAFYMYIKKQDEKWLKLSLSLIIGPLCFVDGAYSIGLFLARQLVKKDRSVDNLVQLLFFYDIPEKLLSKDEALEIAEQILKLNPDNQIALKVIKDKE